MPQPFRPIALAALLCSACVTEAGMQEVADLTQTMALPVCPTETRGWAAWVNAMPGTDAGPTLIVVGEALMPQQAEAELAAGATDRMMPPGQQVMLSIERSGRAAGWQPLRLEIAPSLPEYSSVTIGCDGNAIATISPVEVAH